MRIVQAVLLLLMLLFMAVQYNDPDGWLWIMFYGIPAIFLALAVFRRALCDHQIVRMAMLAGCVLGTLGVIYYWPEQAGFWHAEVFWEAETAREGMGMMIALAVQSFAFASTLKPSAQGVRA